MHVPHPLVHEQRGEGVWDDVNHIWNEINPFSNSKKTEGNSHDDVHAHEKRATVIRTVYLTVDPDFEGDIGGYKTLMKDQVDEPRQTRPPVMNKLELAKDTEQPEPTGIFNNDIAADDIDSVFPSVISQPTVLTSRSELAQASDKPTLSPEGDLVSGGAPTAVTSDRTLPTTPVENENDSAPQTSAGVKAGIAFGVLAGVLVLGLLVYLLFSRRRKQAQSRKNDDEKSNHSNPFDSASDYGASANPHKAPRISLRPVTQFFPTLGNAATSNNNSNGVAKSENIGMAMTSSPATPMGAVDTRALTPDNPFQRPTTSESMNPFGVYAERAPSPLSDSDDVPARSIPPSPMSTDSSPFSDPPASHNTYGTGAGTAPLTRKTSLRKGPAPMDFTIGKISNLGPVPPSPSGTEFSAKSDNAAAIAAAGGPNSAVHRVQLDFKPTLEDELSLKAGDLVRVLHEYDDGWALCIRLDKSAQGVAPRTCLSTRPVKPRPAQGGRPGPPINPQGSTSPRPMTPQGLSARSQSPGPRMQGPPGGRPHSPAGISRRNSPPRLSPMNPAQSAYPADSPESPVNGWPLA